MERMKVLVDLARPMGITCHRAFDMTADPMQAMEDLVKLGIDRILTSGQQPSAQEGASLIKDLIARSAGRIVIMPGSGVKEHNIASVLKSTGASEFHIHLDKQVPSGMNFKRSIVNMGNPAQSEYEHTLTSRERIVKLRMMTNEE
jgi:copper homeostasis protein